MKNLKFCIVLLTLITATLYITSCGNNSNKTEEQGKEYTSVYICPMHCEGSGSEEAGKCPVCGMDYIKNENADEGKNQKNDEDHNH